MGPLRSRENVIGAAVTVLALVAMVFDICSEMILAWRILLRFSSRQC